MILQLRLILNNVVSLLVTTNIVMNIIRFAACWPILFNCLWNWFSCLLLELELFFLVGYPMSQVAARRLVLEWGAADLDRKISVASQISKEGFRLDTLFKKLTNEILQTTSQSSMKPQLIARVLVSMDRLKMGSGSTSWWDRERDYKLLADRMQQCLTPLDISGMSAEELCECTQVSSVNWTSELSGAAFTRIKNVLGEGISEDNQSQQYLAGIVSNLVRRNTKSVIHDDQLWLAEWLCANVYVMTVKDVAILNRCLVNFGFRSHEYHKIWIPYYLERLSELSKNDISNISESFNSLGMSDTLLGGRHFFYKLGKRFQELTVTENGDKEVNQTKKYRNLLQRLG